MHREITNRSRPSKNQSTRTFSNEQLIYPAFGSGCLATDEQESGRRLSDVFAILVLRGEREVQALIYSCLFCKQTTKFQLTRCSNERRMVPEGHERLRQLAKVRLHGACNCFGLPLEPILKVESLQLPAVKTHSK